MAEVDLKAFAAQMREADKATKAAIRRGVRLSASEAGTAVKASAVAILPKGGGLNVWTSELAVTVQQRYNSRGVAITVVGQRKRRGRGKSDMKKMNAGRTAHPVYGRYSPDHGDAHGMFLQDVPPGFFDKPLEGPVVDKVQKQVKQALSDALDKYFT